MTCRWVTIQRNVDDNFHRRWVEFENGFGNNTEGQSYWAGLKTMHEMTKDHPLKMKFTLGSEIIIYDSFQVHDATSNYTLHISGFNKDESNDENGLDPYELHKANNEEFSTSEEGEFNYIPFYFGGGWHGKSNLSQLNKKQGSEISLLIE